MTYNIHHGEGLDGRVDLERIAKLIQTERADIVCLQEVDRNVQRTGRLDLVEELAQLTGMNAAFGKNIDFQGGDYGNAVLTRFAIISQANRHYRMLRPGEQRGLLQLQIEVQGRRLLLLNTHLDFRSDDAERISNVAEIRRVVTGLDVKTPVVITGDFNDVPQSRTHAAMLESFDDAWEISGEGPGYSYSSREPEKRIDYVFVRKGSPLGPVRAWVPRTEASDHLPLVVEFRGWP